MLASIRVKNFALVEDTEIQLDRGFTVFTGETGAGKSLLLHAIILLLGNRASAAWVRKGASKAEVEGQFYLARDKNRIKKLNDMGFEIEDPEDPLVVRREFASAEGTVSRIWIQGKAATRSQLQEALGDMIEVSGQHEFLRLNKPGYILDIVDSLADDARALTQYRETYLKWKDLQRQLAELSGLSLDNIEFLRTEVAELRGICKVDDVKSSSLGDYEETLERQAKELSAKEKVLEQVDRCGALLDGSSGADSNLGMTELARVLDKECRKLGQYTSTEALNGKLEILFQALAEFEAQLLTVRDNFSDENLNAEEILERLSSLKRLKRKYSLQTADAFYELLQRKSDELDKVENVSVLREELAAQIAQQKGELQKRAATLTQTRKKTVATFVRKWEKGVRELGMPHASFAIKLRDLEDFAAHGKDHLDVLFSSNKGQELLALAKVASGGELSRIMLSLKEYVAGQSTAVGVYLFDEVDTGIGGETAHIVGKKLAMLAKSSQVLVVTHLAQIAAFAESQVLVEKSHGKDTSKTELRLLSKSERLDELARMLGGQKLESARKLAEDLVKRVRSEVALSP